MSLLHKTAHKIYTIVWKIFKPQTVGVRGIILKEDKILLVKHSYLDSWFLPGGGLKQNETFENGLKRELKEELGITFQSAKLYGIYNNFYEGKSDSIIVFLIDDFEMNFSKNSEIENFAFFEINQLPDKISPGTQRRINELNPSKKPIVGMW